MLFGKITRERQIRLNSGNVRCFAIPIGWRRLAKTCEERTALRPNPHRFQLREFRLGAEAQGRPVLAQDEAARGFRDRLQRDNAARDLRRINSGVSV